MGIRWTRVAAPLLAGAVLLCGFAGVASAKPGSWRSGSSGARATNAPGADVPGVVVPAADPMGPRHVVMMGDSLAAGLVDAMAAVTAGAVLGETRVGCGWVGAMVVHTPNRAFSQACVDSNEQYLDAVVERAVGADAVVLLSSWESNDHIVDGDVLVFGTPDSDAWFLDRLEMLRARLGTRLVLATVPLGGPAWDRVRDRFVYTQDATDQEVLDHLSELYRDFAAQHDTDVSVVDLGRIVCPERYPCPGRLDGVVLRPEDGAHLSPDGAAWLAPRFLTVLGATLAAQDWLQRPRGVSPVAQRSPKPSSDVGSARPAP